MTDRPASDPTGRRRDAGTATEAEGDARAHDRGRQAGSRSRRPRRPGRAGPAPKAAAAKTQPPKPRRRRSPRLRPTAEPAAPAPPPRPIRGRRSPESVTDRPTAGSTSSEADERDRDPGGIDPRRGDPASTSGRAASRGSTPRTSRSAWAASRIARADRVSAEMSGVGARPSPARPGQPVVRADDVRPGGPRSIRAPSGAWPPAG